MAEYFVVEFAYGGNRRYCFWFSNEKDLLFTEGGVILTFSSLTAIKEYAFKNNMTIGNGGAKYDLDYFANWLVNRDFQIDCELFLDFWNIAWDVSNTVCADFQGNGYNLAGSASHVYDKLFYGNNLPAMRGDGDIYVPQWDSEDIDILYGVICDGMKIIRESIFGDS